MSRKLKALGLALIAVFAMAAISAATASAEELFHSSEAHSIIRGTQVAEDTFTVNAGTVKCKKATYNGTSSATTVKEQRVKPTYSECTAFGFVNTTIDVPSSCEYLFTQPVAKVGKVDIVGCLEPITVTGFNCWVTVGNQNNLGSITYTTGESLKAHDLLIHVSLTGITYTQHSKSFPGCTAGTFTNGTYTGTSTVEALNTAGEPIPLTLE